MIRARELFKNILQNMVLNHFTSLRKHIIFLYTYTMWICGLVEDNIENRNKKICLI